MSCKLLVIQALKEPIGHLIKKKLVDSTDDRSTSKISKKYSLSVLFLFKALVICF